MTTILRKMTGATTRGRERAFGKEVALTERSALVEATPASAFPTRRTSLAPVGDPGNVEI